MQVGKNVIVVAILLHGDTLGFALTLKRDSLGCILMGKATVPNLGFVVHYVYMNNDRGYRLPLLTSDNLIIFGKMAGAHA